VAFLHNPHFRCFFAAAAVVVSSGVVASAAAHGARAVVGVVRAMDGAGGAMSMVFLGLW